MSSGTDRRVAESEAKLNREKAEKELRRFHPDFDQIRTDPKFHDWVAMQPASIQDALYKNNQDAATAARWIYINRNKTSKLKKLQVEVAKNFSR